MWIGSRYGGLVVAKGLDMAPVYLPRPSGDDANLTVEALAVDSTNAVWFGLIEELTNWWWSRLAVGLFRVQDYGYTFFSMSNSGLRVILSMIYLWKRTIENSSPRKTELLCMMIWFGQP